MVLVRKPHRNNQFLYGLSPQHESAAALSALGIFSFLGLVGWLLSLSWFRNPFNQCELPDCRNVNYTVDCGKPHLEYSCRGDDHFRPLWSKMTIT